MISVSMPRACRISCNCEEPGTNAPNRVLSTIRSSGFTSRPGHNAKPWQSRPNVSIMALAAFWGRKISEIARPGRLRLFVDQEADENVDTAGGAHRLGDVIDVGHDVACNRKLNRGSRLHKSVLQVDDDVGGSRRVELVEDVERVAQSFDAVEDFGRHFDLVHDPPPSVERGRRAFCCAGQAPAVPRFGAEPNRPEQIFVIPLRCSCRAPSNGLKLRARLLP